MNVFWVLLVAGALTLGQMLLFKRAGLRGVQVDRHFSRTRLFEGDRIEMIETIENRRILPVPFLRIETRMPSELLLASRKTWKSAGSATIGRCFIWGRGSACGACIRCA